MIEQLRRAQRMVILSLAILAGCTSAPSSPAPTTSNELGPTRIAQPATPDTGRYLVESISMLPTLIDGMYVVVEKSAYAEAPPQRGDIVVFQISGSSNSRLARVIGLPGETIDAIDGIVYINDELLNESYLADVATFNLDKRILGDDEYFVLGDNRNNSRDSRSFGPIQLAEIVGRVTQIYWPSDAQGEIPRPTYTP
jgi:signal peptidase I